MRNLLLVLVFQNITHSLSAHTPYPTKSNTFFDLLTNAHSPAESSDPIIIGGCSITVESQGTRADGNALYSVNFQEMTVGNEPDEISIEVSYGTSISSEERVLVDTKQTILTFKEYEVIDGPNRGSRAYVTSERMISYATSPSENGPVINDLEVSAISKNGFLSKTTTIRCKDKRRGH